MELKYIIEPLKNDGIMSINRTFMELKYGCIGYSINYKGVLIEPLWN